MVRIGQEVEFTPDFIKYGICATNEHRETERQNSTVGTVFFVNPEHEFFVVEYDLSGTKMHESFKFADIGKAVHLIE